MLRRLSSNRSGLSGSTLDPELPEVFDSEDFAEQRRPFRDYRSASVPEALAALNYHGESNMSANIGSAAPLSRPRPTYARQSSLEDPLGLNIVCTAQDPDGDLIFVHGLGGTSRRTWSFERDVDRFWPPWLSSEAELSRFRIFTFGYNANYRGPDNVSNISDFSKDLLFRMSTYSTGADGLVQPLGTYPIMFIAHSMGGLVVKKAYIMGKDNDQYREMVSRVTSMVFLGTPHKGSSLPKTLNNILSSLPLGVSPKIYLAELDKNSSTLQDINEQFKNVCEELMLVSFYETQKTNFRVGPKRVIVEKDSAILGYRQEQTSPLEADHHSICKFKNPDDANYIHVRNILKTLAVKSNPHRSLPRRASTITIVKHLETVLDIQGAPQEDLYILQTKLMQGSCKWIVEKRNFINWTQLSADSPRMYWLTGLPATGKSSVASYVVKYLQEKYSEESCQYHFFPTGHQKKRTGAYLLRSIAFQIARSNASFRTRLLELYETENVVFAHQKLRTIWEKIFEGILFKMQISHPLFWVIDALDETDSSESLTKLFTRFRCASPIKIFMVSRPAKHITSLTMSEVDTVADIRAYVKTTIQEDLRFDGLMQADLIDEILSRASGSFLWVKLALDALKKNWYTKDDIQKALTEIPQGMEQMYEKMICSVAEQEERPRRIATRILTWAACSYRPLRIRELEAALEPEFNIFIKLEDSIGQICGHLVRVINSEVSLIHETARQFLFQRGEGLPIQIHGDQAHEYLALVCIQYLSNDQWKPTFKQASEGVSQLQSHGTDHLAPLIDVNPFLGYAASHWAYHLSKSTATSHDIWLALTSFFDKYCLSWINCVALSGQLRRIIRAAQYLKGYAKKRSQARSLDPPTSLRIEDVNFLKLWAVDLTNLVGKFGVNLIQSPTSIYRKIPPFCPRDSMIVQSYRRGTKTLLSVVGISLSGWDDCFAKVNVGEDLTASRVLCTEQYFVTLSGVKGSMVVWSTGTCRERARMLHQEYVTAIALNKAGTMVVTAGSKSTRAWDVSTGSQRHYYRRRTMARTLTIAFGSTDTEVLVGRDDCMIVCLDLCTGEVKWEFLAAEGDDDDRSCARGLEFSPHQSYVAISFRGKPVTIWDLSQKENQRPRRCIPGFDRQKGAADVYTTPHVICWEPEGSSVLILYQNNTLTRWHILDDEQEEFNHIGAREMTISQDGNMLLTSDYSGSISVWTFPRFHLLYKLNQEDFVRDLAFSPDGQRFYDTRGSICHVWEPDALVRAEGLDQDNASIYEGSLGSEPVVTHNGEDTSQVTALASDEEGTYFCCGKDDGSVAIYNISEGKRLRKVYSHDSSVSIIALAWSPSGKYMVSADDSSRIIAKRLERKEPDKWAVYPVLGDIRVGGTVQQFLFSLNEKLLLVSTASSDRVYDLKAKEEICRRWWRTRFGRRWTNHPTNKSLLIWIDPNETRIYTWNKLDLVEDSLQDGTMASGRDDLRRGSSDFDRRPAQEASQSVQWVSFTNSQFIYSIVQERGNNLPGSKAATQLEKLPLSELERPRPQRPLREPIMDLATHAKQIIGCFQGRIAFFDFEYRVCTWEIGADIESLKRWFFIPRDWLSPLTLQLAMVNHRGTFLCPKNGEMAVVKYGGMV